MKLILFYEKPGCSTNAKQKKILENAGCTIISRNILQHNMDEDELFTYLNKIPCVQWFNPNAPAIKSGELDPHTLSEKEALTMLLYDPILIRRPLISVDGQRMCGFDTKAIETILGVSLQSQDEECSSDTACFSPVPPTSSK
ncbi:MAG TPA: arsenate reductase family protein [Epsilonproteobacteria bacterium]|nr:arsenate reductase family protein [Campylobacterota bacterium]